MLSGSVVACGPSPVAEDRTHEVDSQVEELAHEIAFHLDIDSRCEYEPDAPWHGLSQEELDDPKNEEVKALVDDETSICALHIGENVRIYTAFAQWRPCTLEVLNDDESVRKLVRLDTPPTGIVRVPLDVLDIDPEKEGTLRFTKVEVRTGSIIKSESRNDYMVVNPMIGVDSEPLTHDKIRELGFSEGLEHVHEGLGVRISNEEWTTTSSSSTISFSPEKWALYAATDDSSLHAGHGGNNGVAPSEGWWARRVAEHFFGSS